MINLKLICAYWCNSVSAEYEERFFWSTEKVNNEAVRLDDEARLLLHALASSAPDEQTLAYFAAGPLEDHINHIVRKRSASDAAYILGNKDLSALLPLVWGGQGEARVYCGE